METMMTVVTATLAVMAGLGLVLAGGFSLVTLLWDDLLETDRPDHPPECQEAA